MSEEIRICAGISLVLAMLIGGLTAASAIERQQINSCLEKQSHRAAHEARMVCVGMK